MTEKLADTSNHRKLNEIDIHVGNRIRLRREILSLTQEELGQKLGLSVEQIQKYEKAINRVGAGQLQKIAMVLNVSTSFFFDNIPNTISRTDENGLSENDYDKDVLDFILSADGLEFMNVFLKIKEPAARKKLLQLMNELARGSN